jgi:hypothetical protein
MIRRSLSYEWTEEDLHTRSKWRRGIAVLYGCMALLVFALLALTKPPSPNEARDRQTWSANLQGERINPTAAVPRKAK